VLALPLLLNSLEPTLLDSMFFSMYGGYTSRTARLMATAYGFGKTKPGVGVTNLGRAPLDSRYGNLTVEAARFIPPYWPNAELIVGIVTAADEMRIAVTYSRNELEDASIAGMLDEALSLLG